MAPNKPLNIVILGGGTAGWMAANLFAKRWAFLQVNIKLIESPNVSTIGVGEGSTPSLKHFFKTIEVAESDWMPACKATYKLNIKFDQWSPQSGIKSYSHPFTTQVDLHTSSAFMTNARTRRLGLRVNTKPEDFLLNGVLAAQGKGPITPENFPFAIEYGYHFDSKLLGEFLSKLAQTRGVNYQQQHIQSVVQQPNGNIAALVTEQGERIEADLFVDCTGFASVLMQKSLKAEFDSFSSNLFNNSAVVVQTESDQEFSAETISTAMSAGWIWKIPLTSRYGNGYVFSSDFISKDNAELEFRKHLGIVDDDLDCHHLDMRVGQLKQHWKKNCIAIGLSQGFIEPLEATALHLVQISIEAFIDYYEKGDFSDRYKDNYNRDIYNRFESVRDYIVAHYKLNSREDSEYWRANRNNTHLSTNLSRLLDCWFRKDDLRQLFQEGNFQSHFDAVSWNCLLAGYGAFPPLANNQPGQGDLYKELKVHDFLAGCSLNFESHKSNLHKLLTS